MFIIIITSIILWNRHPLERTGALTHGLIHLGWALDANNERMTDEGLAYLAYTHLSCHPERFVSALHTDDEDAFASMCRIADEYEAQDVRGWVARTKADPR
jgi:hypothetical protein